MIGGQDADEPRVLADILLDIHDDPGVAIDDFIRVVLGSFDVSTCDPHDRVRIARRNGRGIPIRETPDGQYLGTDGGSEQAGDAEPEAGIVGVHQFSSFDALLVHVPPKQQACRSFLRIQLPLRRSWTLPLV